MKHNTAIALFFAFFISPQLFAQSDSSSTKATISVGMVNSFQRNSGLTEYIAAGGDLNDNFWLEEAGNSDPYPTDFSLGMKLHGAKYALRFSVEYGQRYDRQLRVDNAYLSGQYKYEYEHQYQLIGTRFRLGFERFVHRSDWRFGFGLDFYTRLGRGKVYTHTDMTYLQDGTITTSIDTRTAEYTGLGFAGLLSVEYRITDRFSVALENRMDFEVYSMEIENKFEDYSFGSVNLDVFDTEYNGFRRLLRPLGLLAVNFNF